MRAFLDLHRARRRRRRGRRRGRLRLHRGLVLGYGKAAAIAAVVDLWCAARHVTAHSSQARTQKGRDGAGPSSHSGPQGTQPMGRPEFRPGLT